jgi:hypothetical protein
MATDFLSFKDSVGAGLLRAPTQPRQGRQTVARRREPREPAPQSTQQAPEGRQSLPGIRLVEFPFARRDSPNDAGPVSVPVEGRSRMADREVTRTRKDKNDVITALCNPSAGWSPRSKVLENVRAITSGSGRFSEPLSSRRGATSTDLYSLWHAFRALSLPSSYLDRPPQRQLSAKCANNLHIRSIRYVRDTDIFRDPGRVAISDNSPR